MAKGKYEYWLTEEGLIKLEGWARDGLTDEQIAHNIGVNVKTLYEWKKRFCNISKSLKMGKEVADYIVENALFKSACGYEYDEITQEPLYDNNGHELLGTDGKQIVKVTKVTTKQVNPNATSIIYWLKNRRPDKWRDKPEGKSDSQNIADIAKNTADLAEILLNPVENRSLPDE